MNMGSEKVQKQLLLLRASVLSVSVELRNLQTFKKPLDKDEQALMPEHGQDSSVRAESTEMKDNSIDDSIR